MAEKIPLDVSIGTLPPKPTTETRQEFAEKIAARLLVYLPSTNSTFVLGGSQPTSDEGPWFKEVSNPKTGNSSYELWIWSVDAATYKPLTLNQVQLRYFFGTAAPDQAVYDVWVKVDGNGAPLGVFTYNTSTAAWEQSAYTVSEIDAFFEGTAGDGKKLVAWGNVTGKPNYATTAPRSVTGILTPADVRYNWEQVFHSDIGQMVIYDPDAGLWKTLGGGIGDLKEVSGTTLGASTDFSNGIFTSILGKNPGWTEDTASIGRTVVGASTTELWDVLTTNKKEAGSTHGVDNFVMSVGQLATHDHSFDAAPTSGAQPIPILGAGGTPVNIITDDTGSSEPISLVQKSIAYYRIRKTV